MSIYVIGAGPPEEKESEGGETNELEGKLPVVTLWVETTIRETQSFWAQNFTLIL